MYVPPLYRNDDRSQVIGFLRERGFGLAVAAGADGPIGAHVPFVADEADDDGRLRLRFHVARANPLWSLADADARILVAVGGADAYISPDWYVAAEQVPTWNYVAVHCSGTARLMPADGLLRLLADLSADQERRLLPKAPWTLDKLSPAALDRLLKAIVGIEVTVDRIDAQWKLSQNKKPADTQGAIAGLDARGDTSSLAVAALMRERSTGA